MYILYILAFGASLINPFEGFLPQSKKVGHETFRRRGRTCLEFLLMRSFASYEDCFGDVHCSSLVSEPVSCPSKHTWIIFGALEQWLPLARALGHCGILVYHYCLDGGLFTSLSRRCRQRHDLYYKSLANAVEATRLKNKDWLLRLCAAFMLQTMDWNGLATFICLTYELIWSRSLALQLAFESLANIDLLVAE